MDRKLFDSLYCFYTLCDFYLNFEITQVNEQIGKYSEKINRYEQLKLETPISISTISILNFGIEQNLKRISNAKLIKKILTKKKCEMKSFQKIFLKEKPFLSSSYIYENIQKHKQELNNFLNDILESNNNT